jgi:hypothetical protein
MGATIKRASLILLALLVAFAISEWTVWTATVESNQPVAVDQDACDAAGDRYREVAARPITQLPNPQTVPQEEYNAARSERAAQIAERSAALREYSETCQVGAARPSP